MKKKMKPIVKTKKNPANGLQVVVPNHIEGESRVINAAIMLNMCLHLVHLGDPDESWVRYLIFLTSQYVQLLS